MQVKSFAVTLLLVGLFVASSFGGLATPEELHNEIKRQSSVTTSSSTDDSYRAFQANWYPTIDPRILQLVGVSAHLNQEQDTATVDAVEFILDDLFQTTLFFGYYHAQGTIPTRNQQTVSDFSAAAFAFATRAFAVFEYLNNDGNPGYQNGTSDQLTGIYDLSSFFLQWNPMEVTTSNSTVNGTEFTTFIVTIQTTDEVFLMRFVCVGYSTEVEGQKITPTSIKVDFEIQWFNNPLHVPALWTTGPSDAATYPDAQVGMFSVFAAAAGEFSKTTDPNTNKPGLQFAAGGYVGFFQWETQANVTVGGVEAAGGVVGTIQTVNDSSVNASFAAEWIVQACYFSFEAFRPSDVSWDPVFGAQVAAPASNPSPAVKIETSFITIFCAIIVLLAVLSPNFM